MRKLAVCLGLCVLLAKTGTVFGQSEPFSPTFTEPAKPGIAKAKSPFADPTFTLPARENQKPKTVPRRGLTRSKSTAAQLIQLRAIKQGNERRARIATRQRQGISLLRPARSSYYTVLQDWDRVNGPAWRGRGDRNFFRIR